MPENAGQVEGAEVDESQTEAKVDAEKKAETFTQQDVDRIVRERVQREKAKYSDYDDLKKSAEAKKTADERIAELEARYAEAETRALRASIASQHGISTEDRDLFLTGTDEETLTAQAKRLAERESDRRQSGNHAPSEGANPGQSGSSTAAFARSLFSGD